MSGIGPTSPKELPRVRYRGLHLPLHARLLPEATAKALRAGTWQTAYTEAAFALARPDDTALVWGGGTGHVAAILAGKLGLPRVYVTDPGAEGRSHLAAIAWLNGLPRLSLVATEDAAAISATLLFVDLSAAAFPSLAYWPYLRAAAVDLGPEPEAADLAAVCAAAEDNGLRQDETLSADACRVFVRSRGSGGD